MKDFPKELVCEFSGIEVIGNALIRCWDDSVGIIKMDPFMLKKNDIDVIESIKNGLNDGGFGCKEILGANVRMIAQYTNGAELVIEDKIIQATTEDIEPWIDQLETYCD